MFKRKSKSIVPENTIVTSDMAHVKPEKISKPKKLSLKNLKSRFTKKTVSVTALAIILVLSPVFYMYTQHTGWFNKPFTPVKPVIDPNATPEEVDTAVIAAREEELDQLIANEKEAAQKREYQHELALIYLHQGKKEQAIDLATEVEESGQTASSAGALAAIYSAQGNYQQAAKYYGIAMERSPKPSRSTERAPYNDYANLKKEAEAAQ